MWKWVNHFVTYVAFLTSTYLTTNTSELSSLVQDLMNDIDIKPLHPKHKLLLYSRYVLSRLSWHVTKAIACSKRSDSGEWCEVKKAMKSRGELGREVRERL